MRISTKELRLEPGKIVNEAANGKEITVTFRGKALAKIVPIKKRLSAMGKEDTSIFGLWKDHEQTSSVEDQVRALRKGRQF